MIVEHVGQRYVDKFKTKGLDYFVRIDNLEGNNGARMYVNDLMARLTVSIQEMLNRVLDAIPNHDFVRIVINNRYQQNAIYVPFQRRDQINVQTILDTIEKLLNSNEEFLIDGFFEVNVIHVNMLSGGRSKIPYESSVARLKKSESTARVKNKDNMCPARAIVIGKAKADKDPKYASIRDSNPMQTRVVKSLGKAAGVDHSKQCGLSEFEKFQAYLTDYQLCVVSKDHLFGFIYKGEHKKKKSTFFWLISILMQ